MVYKVLNVDNRTFVEKALTSGAPEDAEFSEMEKAVEYIQGRAKDLPVATYLVVEIVATLRIKAVEQKVFERME